MGKIEHLIELAKENPQKIVLPEINDKRVYEAAKIINKERIADLILLTGEKNMELGIDFFEDVIMPAEHPSINEICTNYYEFHKHEGVSYDAARKVISENPLYFAAMMVRLDMADGFVAGASHYTGDVIRAALQCLGIDRSIGVISGVFLMEMENCPYGEDGFFVFADCAVIPTPSTRQLVKIASSSADLLRRLFKIEGRVAFLSYSSHGSAESESISRAREAVEKLRQQRPDLIVDGELQLDAAIIPEVQQIKAPDSPLKGRANVLIFPNLDAASIAYNAVERFGKAKAIGPALLGLNEPVSDLSRGCSIEDIVAAVALTVVRAQ